MFLNGDFSSSHHEANDAPYGGVPVRRTDGISGSDPHQFSVVPGPPRDLGISICLDSLRSQRSGESQRCDHPSPYCRLPNTIQAKVRLERRPGIEDTECRQPPIPWGMAAVSGSIRGRNCQAPPWQFLYFFPLPHGQGSLRPTFFSRLRIGSITLGAWPG